MTHQHIVITLPMKRSLFYVSDEPILDPEIITWT